MMLLENECRIEAISGDGYSLYSRDCQRVNGVQVRAARAAGRARNAVAYSSSEWSVM
jgi:hypothetical protein